jgi:hypothetical protein
MRTFERARTTWASTALTVHDMMNGIKARRAGYGASPTRPRSYRDNYDPNRCSAC